VVFSSNVFLFAFLPAVLIGYYLIGSERRNGFLFLASLVFYLWGSGWVVFLLLLTVVVNHHLGRAVAGRPWLLALGVAYNLSFLLYFKYFGFFREELGRLAGLAGWPMGPFERILLPIGISFYTFQALSYVIDCYQKKHPPAERLVDFGMYLTSFPQLIAGPIVRFDQIRERIRRRPLNLDEVFQGLWRFSLGLAKKVVLANNLGLVADQVLAAPLGELRPEVAWLGALCYTFQIYYDFSGYSDMAIGLGRMLGFTFPENFNQPYRSRSITEFWRRWHMTLSGWFRDYVYVPLGGNRRGQARTYRNLWIVFLLCGLWHGAAWTFVLWGCYHGLLLVIERVLRARWGFQGRGPLAQLVTFVLIIFGWVIFRLESLGQALDYSAVMLCLSRPTGFQFYGLAYYLRADVVLYLSLAFFFGLFPFERLEPWFKERAWVRALQGAGGLGLVFLAALFLSVAGFNPFIYFQF